MIIRVQGTYHGFLSSVERLPVADIWMSSPDPSWTFMNSINLEESSNQPREEGIRSVVQRFWESVASQGRMRRHTSFFDSSVVLQWDSTRVPADTALHFQVFVALDEEELETPNLGIIPAGSAHTHLRDLMENEYVMLPIVHQSLQDEMMYSDGPDTLKGVLILRLASDVDPGISFLPSDRLAITKENDEAIRTAFRSVIEQRTLRATAGVDGALTMPPTLPEMVRVRAEDYATPAGVNLLDAEFFSMCNVPDADPATIWMFMKRSALQQGWTPETFGRRLRLSIETPGPVPLECYIAQEIFVRALTMLANAIHYSSDYAVVHYRGRPNLTIVESFDDAQRRGVCDCEDDAKLEAGIFLFLRDKISPSAEWQTDVQTFARAFVCVVTLRSVCSSALDHVKSVSHDDVINLLQPIQADQAGAHMHAVLYPIHVFEKFCRNGHIGLGSIKSPIVSERPTKSDNLHVLYCEGTGPMSPFVYDASKYMGGSAGVSWQRMQIASEHVLMHPSMPMLERFIPMHIGPSDPVPAPLRFLRKARQVLRRNVEAHDTAHNFYRLAGDGFVPGLDVGGFRDIDGRQMTFSKFTYCMQTPTGGFTRGVPIMYEASQSEKVAFKFFSDPGSEVDEINKRVRHHIPPARQVDARNPSSDFIAMANTVMEIFMEAVGDRADKIVDKIVQEDVGRFGPEGVVVVLHRFARTTSLTDKRIRAVANMVRMNSAILRASVSSVFLGPTAWQTDFVFEVFVAMNIFEATVLP